MVASRKIFLAHAHEDKPRIRELYVELKSRGFEPWLDAEDLIPGQVWKDEIPRAIRNAGAFLACLSYRSVKKVGYVQSEFRLALSAFADRPPGSIYLIPVRLDDCLVPDLQIPDRGLALRDLHWVDLWQDDGLEKLAKALARAVDAEPTKQTIADDWLSLIRTGELVVNLNIRSVEVKGRLIHLTATEYNIIELLSLRKGEVMDREIICDHLYGGIDPPELKAIDVFVMRLRKKLSAASGGNGYVETVWGRGYILNDPV